MSGRQLGAAGSAVIRVADQQHAPADKQKKISKKSGDAMAALTAGRRDTAECDLTIVNARNLPAMDLNGKSDPYVLVVLFNDFDAPSFSNGGRQTRSSLEKSDAETSGMAVAFRTPVVYKTLDPDWEQIAPGADSLKKQDKSGKKASAGSFFFVPGGRPQVQLRVFDRDRVDRDDFIGMAILPPLEDYADEKEHDVTLPLLADTKKQEARGTITVRLSIKDPNGLGLSSRRVFGVPLASLWGPSEIGDEVERFVPRLVRDCISAIDTEANLQKEGIFRLSGSSVVIADYRARCNRGEQPDMSAATDVHTVCGLLKLFFREMPEPVIPFSLYDSFLEAAALPAGSADRSQRLQQLLQQLPRGNFVLAWFLMSFLTRVSYYAEANKMNLENLATVFGPNLLMPSASPNPMSMMQDTPAINTVVCALITTPALFDAPEDSA
jgi:RhoGAP domain/C2 domain